MTKPKLTEKQLKVISAVISVLVLAALAYLGFSPDPELVEDAVEVAVQESAEALEVTEEAPEEPAPPEAKDEPGPEPAEEAGPE